MAGNDEREHKQSETKQKAAPKQEPAQPPAPSPDSFEEETETSKLTGVGAW